jgi:hypothetical protein
VLAYCGLPDGSVSMSDVAMQDDVAWPVGFVVRDGFVTMALPREPDAYRLACLMRDGYLNSRHSVHNLARSEVGISHG